MIKGVVGGDSYWAEVPERERERETEGGRERVREKERERCIERGNTLREE